MVKAIIKKAVLRSLDLQYICILKSYTELNSTLPVPYSLYDMTALASTVTLNLKKSA